MIQQLIIFVTKIWALCLHLLGLRRQENPPKHRLPFTSQHIISQKTQTLTTALRNSNLGNLSNTTRTLHNVIIVPWRCLMSTTDINMYGGVIACVYAFLTSETDGAECLRSNPGYLTTGQWAPSIKQIEK